MLSDACHLRVVLLDLVRGRGLVYKVHQKNPAAGTVFIDSRLSSGRFNTRRKCLFQVWIHRCDRLQITELLKGKPLYDNKD